MGISRTWCQSGGVCFGVRELSYVAPIYTYLMWHLYIHVLCGTYIYMF